MQDNFCFVWLKNFLVLGCFFRLGLKLFAGYVPICPDLSGFVWNCLELSAKEGEDVGCL